MGFSQRESKTPLLDRAVSPMGQRRAFLLSFSFSFFFILSLGRVFTGRSTDQVPILENNMLFVSKNRLGAFRSIQGAIESVPSGNNQWIRIHVEAGVYSEKVLIPADKPFIFLEGEGRDQTFIEWGAHTTVDVLISPTTTTADTATFTVFADNFVARWITFKNTFQLEGIWAKRAVAAMIGGDKSSFHGCRFLGFQDTLCDLSGRHYFTDCYIEGSIDFIFGYAQSLYDKCTLFVLKNTVPGWVTAQGRAGPGDLGGFVFNGCNLTGDGEAYLGRAWGPYARVVFYGTSMSNVVVPEGWDPWHYKGQEGDFTFVESDCTGPGAKTSQRVPWEQELGDAELRQYTSITFIDNEGWLGRQP